MRYGLRRWTEGVSDGLGASVCCGEGSYLFPHFPHALHTMEQVAAPQQLAAQDRSCAGVSDGLDHSS
jgi:hypothetical protein